MMTDNGPEQEPLLPRFSDGRALPRGDLDAQAIDVTPEGLVEWIKGTNPETGRRRLAGPITEESLIGTLAQHPGFNLSDEYTPEERVGFFTAALQRADMGDALPVLVEQLAEYPDHGDGLAVLLQEANNSLDRWRREEAKAARPAAPIAPVGTVPSVLGGLVAGSGATLEPASPITTEETTPQAEAVIDDTEARVRAQDMRLRARSFAQDPSATHFGEVKPSKYQRETVLAGTASAIASGAKRLLVVEPPGAGKTLLGIWSGQIVGVGDTPPGTSRPTRICHITPTRLAVTQQVGTEAKPTGYGLLTSAGDLDEEWQRGELFDNLTAAKIIWLHDNRPEEFEALRKSCDIFTVDEAHRMIGPKYVQVLDELIGDKPAVFYTATDKFSHDHNVTKAFNIDREVSRRSFLDGVNDGDMNGVQLFTLPTDATLVATGANGELTEEDMAVLRDGSEVSRRHNAQALQLLKTMVLDKDMPTLVACVPGENSQHARRLAEQFNLLLKELYGEDEAPLAAAIGNFQSRAKNEKIIDRFNRGELMVLTGTEMILESLDSVKVRGLIDMVARTSDTDKGQFSGRGGRPKPYLTVHIEFLHRIIGSHRGLSTFPGVYSVQYRDQGMIIISDKGKGPQKRRQVQSGQAGALDLHDFPVGIVQDLEKATPELVHQRTIATGVYADPPEDWVPLEPHTIPPLEQFTEKTRRDIVAKALARVGMQLVLTTGERGSVTAFVPPNIAELAEQIDTIQVNLAEMVAVKSLGEFIPGGVSETLFRTIVAELDIRVYRGRPPGDNQKQSRFIGVQDLIRINTYIRKNYPYVDTSADRRIADLAKEFGVSESTIAQRIRDAVSRADTPIDTYRRYTIDRRRPVICVRADQYDTLVELIAKEYPFMTRGATPAPVGVVVKVETASGQPVTDVKRPVGVVAPPAGEENSKQKPFSDEKLAEAGVTMSELLETWQTLQLAPPDTLSKPSAEYDDAKRILARLQASPGIDERHKKVIEAIINANSLMNAAFSLISQRILTANAASTSEDLQTQVIHQIRPLLTEIFDTLRE